MAQQNMVVGDIAANTKTVIDCAQRACFEHDADIIIFSELTLCGYPPEDLLLRPDLHQRIEKALMQLQVVKDIFLVIGLPGMGQKGLENQAVVIHQGKVITRYAKQLLPNYQVFDERRYFLPGEQAQVFNCHGVCVGLSVCMDLWYPQVAAQLKKQGAELILSLNASPFDLVKQKKREQLVAKRCRENHCAIVYVNQVGGQDELLFDGASFAVNPNGALAACAPSYESGLFPLVYDSVSRQITVEKAELNPDRVHPSEDAILYNALVLSVRDYVHKNGFSGIILGLSGGIDSALVLAIAVDALGANRVETVMMPSQYTAQMSLDDAETLAARLKVNYQVITIDDLVKSFSELLSESFNGMAKDTTEENIQSRCRGVLLMALSNKKRLMVLTTGNKSEMAVGYATLYGDMVGGFNPLKDVYKTRVYTLAHFRNQRALMNGEAAVITQRIIDRPPTAELKSDQKDSDSLPDYELLDQILTCYIEYDLSAEEIIKKLKCVAGFNADIVYRIIPLVDRNEYKRQQSPVGVRVTHRGFGKDRRYPITFNWPA